MPSYSTSTAVGSLLGTTFSGTTDPTQAEVNDVLLRVSAHIDQVTGRGWTAATTSEYHDTRSAYERSETRFPYRSVQSVFFLKRYPVTSVQSVQENTSGLSGETFVSRASGYGGDWIFYADEGAVRFHRNHPQPGFRNIKVSYTYGESPTPDDIRYAAELLAAAEAVNMIKRGSDQEGLKSVSIGNAAYTFGDLDRQEKGYKERAMALLAARGYFIHAEGR